MIRLPANIDYEVLREHMKEYGGIFKESELERLLDNYSSYMKDYRSLVLPAFLGEVEIPELIEDRLTKLGKSAKSPRSAGGHTRWCNKRFRNTFYRLMYLRFTLEGGLSKTEAITEILRMCPRPGRKDRASRKLISEATKDPVCEA